MVRFEQRSPFWELLFLMCASKVFERNALQLANYSFRATLAR